MKKRFRNIVIVSYMMGGILLGAGWTGISRMSSGNNVKVEWNEAVHVLGISLGEEEKLRKMLDYINIWRTVDEVRRMYALMAFICFAGLTVFFIYFYCSSVRPFIRMERFAGELAGGNFEFPLEIDRSRMFGTFTWAFDHMREELKEAREKEEKAIEKNRTMIAGISHDIKSPVANIRNYCEGLSLMPEALPERRKSYLDVILKKCDEVSALTDDLFLHSLKDMDRLSVELVPVRADEIWSRILCPLREQSGVLKAVVLKEVNTKGHGKLLDRVVLADERRLTQVFENLLNNAQKYAPGSTVEIRAAEVEEKLCILFKDDGPGIPEEDIVYAVQKFYRGSNSLNQQGAGLGLYISEVLMKQMGGELRLRNQDGLEAALLLQSGILAGSPE